MIEDDEIVKILAACAKDKHNVSLRDTALITMMFATGARRDEITGMNIEDYDPDALCVKVRKGKGRKERQIFIGKEVARIIDAWLEARGVTLDKPLFTRIYRNDHITDLPLTGAGVYHILSERAAEAGVTDITPHDFRRTFISGLIDKGVDLSTIAKLAGHACL